MEENLSGDKMQKTITTYADVKISANIIVRDFMRQVVTRGNLFPTTWNSDGLVDIESPSSLL